MCVSTVKQLEKVIALEGGDIKPMFGICMGNQLMGLAAGCTAEKLPFGNRGQNQVRKSTLRCRFFWHLLALGTTDSAGCRKLLDTFLFSISPSPCLLIFDLLRFTF